MDAACHECTCALATWQGDLARRDARKQYINIGNKRTNKPVHQHNTWVTSATAMNRQQSMCESVAIRA
jgi:hypothetical protein